MKLKFVKMTKYYIVFSRFSKIKIVWIWQFQERNILLDKDQATFQEHKI